MNLSLEVFTACSNVIRGLVDGEAVGTVEDFDDVCLGMTGLGGFMLLPGS
jgi:hypothetical protein